MYAFMSWRRHQKYQILRRKQTNGYTSFKRPRTQENVKKLKPFFYSF